MRRAYERDGYVVVRQLLSSEQTIELKAAVLAICRNETSGRTFKGQDFSTPASDREALERYLAVHAPDKLSDKIKEFVKSYEPMQQVRRPSGEGGPAGWERVRVGGSLLGSGTDAKS